jgi:hypothetical protein
MASHAREHEIRVEVRRQMLRSYDPDTVAEPSQSYPVVLDPAGGTSSNTGVRNEK